MKAIRFTPQSLLITLSVVSLLFLTGCPYTGTPDKSGQETASQSETDKTESVQAAEGTAEERGTQEEKKQMEEMAIAEERRDIREEKVAEQKMAGVQMSKSQKAKSSRRMNAGSSRLMKSTGTTAMFEPSTEVTVYGNPLTFTPFSNFWQDGSSNATMISLLIPLPEKISHQDTKTSTGLVQVYFGTGSSSSTGMWHDQVLASPNSSGKIVVKVYENGTEVGKQVLENSDRTSTAPSSFLYLTHAFLEQPDPEQNDYVLRSIMRVEESNNQTGYSGSTSSGNSSSLEYVHNYASVSSNSTAYHNPNDFQIHLDNTPGSNEYAFSTCTYAGRKGGKVKLRYKNAGTLSKTGGLFESGSSKSGNN